MKISDKSKKYIAGSIFPKEYLLVTWFEHETQNESETNLDIRIFIIHWTQEFKYSVNARDYRNLSKVVKMQETIKAERRFSILESFSFKIYGKS